MYLKCLLLCQLMTFLLVEDSQALSCIPCSMRMCPSDLRCPGGKVRETCDCCLKCAMVEGETCGGLYNYLGICDEGLECVKEEPTKFSKGVCHETFLAKLKRLRK
ncbi:hypothetical protein Q7C36_022909 [Tachysurus vachellii]|uniref:IGFBP N-terminal domain-containing protein n=2 Tax=Tachysurus vachellii TaxID=175792 RepID=A0AA88IPX1_TACVA|nr:hypothetical protein Q7C36_022909 [Tachysurus vachellii]